MCKAKIHGAQIVKTDLHYQGSVTIAKELLDASGILPNEVVQVINVNTGVRFETYTIEGKKDSGVALNGGAARMGEVGDTLIILSYAFIGEDEISSFSPRVVMLGDNNKIVKVK